MSYDKTMNPLVNKAAARFASWPQDVLVMAATGTLDLNDAARAQLAARGRDERGNLIGEAAAKQRYLELTLRDVA